MDDFSRGISIVQRSISNIPIQVRVASPEVDRVLADPPTRGRVVPARLDVIDPGVGLVGVA